MSVTQQLLDLFRVDKQLRGLRNRLDQAERFLSQQSTLLKTLDTNKQQLEEEAKKRLEELKKKQALPQPANAFRDGSSLTIGINVR